MFQLLLAKEYQRLKAEEQRLIGWSAKRDLSKIDYRIHTDVIQQNLVPEETSSAQASVIYVNEADVLNVAMFGMTAKQWREAHPDLKGNIHRGVFAYLFLLILETSVSRTASSPSHLPIIKWSSMVKVAP